VEIGIEIVNRNEDKLKMLVVREVDGSYTFCLTVLYCSNCASESGVCEQTSYLDLTTSELTQETVLAGLAEGASFLQR
jgi:hypothetical protein